MAEITIENVEGVFRSMPAPENVQEQIKLLEDRFVEMAKTIITNVPRSQQRTNALLSLLKVKMVCIDTIVKGGLI